MSRQLLHTLTDIKLMSLLIWHEARGESPIGKLAVAHVVINRVGKRTWYGHSIRDVITKPYQFSAFNNDNFAFFYEPSCVAIAELALGGVTIDPTKGATHFHADYITPTWASDMTHLLRIGRHLFYKAKNE